MLVVARRRAVSLPALELGSTVLLSPSFTPAARDHLAQLLLQRVDDRGHDDEDDEVRHGEDGLVGRGSGEGRKHMSSVPEA